MTILCEGSVSHTPRTKLEVGWDTNYESHKQDQKHYRYNEKYLHWIKDELIVNKNTLLIIAVSMSAPANSDASSRCPDRIYY